MKVIFMIELYIFLPGTVVVVMIW